MSTCELTFEGQKFLYQKEEACWEVILKRSDAATQNLDRLVLLNVSSPFFLRQEMQIDEDTIRMIYEIEPDGITFSEIRQRSRSEQFRFAINLMESVSCLDLPVSFFLHPENLFITKDEKVKIAYRSLPGILKPDRLDDQELLLQLKCVILELFTKYHFQELYDGGIETAALAEFPDEVRKAENYAMLLELLQMNYRESKAIEESRFRVVRKTSYRIYRHASIWLGVLAVILVIPLIYLIFIKGPLQEKMLDTDEAFLKLDYSGVISELNGIALSDLPYTQKYELAYSYVKNLNFTEDQEDVIMNSITLKTEELYLDYWIQIGREENDDAIDLAKRLSDSDLILYALAEKIEEVRGDEELSGEEREELLESLESEYNEYWEARTESLAEGSETSSEEETSSSDSTDSNLSE